MEGTPNVSRRFLALVLRTHNDVISKRSYMLMLKSSSWFPFLMTEVDVGLFVTTQLFCMVFYGLNFLATAIWIHLFQ